MCEQGWRSQCEATVFIHIYMQTDTEVSIQVCICLGSSRHMLQLFLRKDNDTPVTMSSLVTQILVFKHHSPIWAIPCFEVLHRGYVFHKWKAGLSTNEKDCDSLLQSSLYWVVWIGSCSIL